jgi:hypothetical protein
MPLIGAIVLLTQAGCVDGKNKAQFYTYCDTSGCYQCDSNGCGAVSGSPPGAVCKTSNDCASGCYCSADSKCSEAGFCDRPTDCARGFSCNVGRHSCEPNGGGNIPPKTCRAAADCGAGNECFDTQCRPAPVPPNHCVFNRECGSGGGGQCEDGLCQKACVADSGCGTGRACINKRCAPKPIDNTSCASSAACGAGQACIDGACHLSCSKDTECQVANTNDICVSSLCRPDERRVPECKANLDCTGGQECVNAQCRTFCMADSDCALCAGNNTVCNTGYCGTTREAKPQCQLAGDCSGGAGPHCADGACTQ